MISHNEQGYQQRCAVLSTTSVAALAKIVNLKLMTQSIKRHCTVFCRRVMCLHHIRRQNLLSESTLYCGTVCIRCELEVGANGF